MSQVNPGLQLQTLCVLNGAGRIVSTREPQPRAGPAFMLIRGASACAWAVGVDLADRVADELNALAAQEPVSTDWRQPPVHAPRYQQVLSGHARSGGRSGVRCGPAFAFPETIGTTGDARRIDDEAQLSHHFSGWT